MTVQPYKHDCPTCRWYGWMVGASIGKNDLANVYLCNKGEGWIPSIIVRYGDKPEEYLSLSGGGVRGAIDIDLDKYKQ